MSMLRRVLLIATCLVLLLGLGIAVAFQFWLRDQPEETQATIRSLTTWELLVAARYELFPPLAVDRAGFGRKLVPGRGHAPWILRSSLDGRPRMLQLALAPGIWLSYGTETGSLYQLWRGELEQTGAVYDMRHGPEPVSTGAAYLRHPDESDWRVAEGAEWVIPDLRYLGHGVAPETGRAYLLYELSHAGRMARIRESPELVRNAEMLGLERRFRFESNPEQLQLALTLRPGATSFENEGGTLEDGRLLLEEGETTLTQWFDAPGWPLERRRRAGTTKAVSRAEAWIEGSDCITCHARDERLVGPAWSEIALRYANEPKETITEQLATTILNGGANRWGQGAMPPHPDLSRAQAATIARHILAITPQAEMTIGADAAARARYAWTYDTSVLPRPEELHPSLQATRILPEGFTPKVGGLGILPDGRLVVATWDADGAVFLVADWQGPGAEVEVTRIAEGLQEPLGITVVDGSIYVMQKQEVTRLVDVDGDDWIDEYQAVSQAWEVTSNFHEFGFGLAHDAGYLYGTLSVCVMPGGKSCPDQTPDRGVAFRVSLADGSFERFADGFRTPNGVSWLPDRGLLVTDNQGDWLPASKLLLVERGSFHGWRQPGETGELPEPSRPTIWLPQNEVGNSPTQPVVLRRGPYAGHILFGDIYNGGLKRVVLEEVGGHLQGAAFHFSAGLEGGVNRLLEAPDGSLVVGEIGSKGNWGDPGKAWFGLERLRFGDETAFEPFAVRATPRGFEIELTRPLAAETTPTTADITASDWFYVPSSRYGGPKFDLRELLVTDVRLSLDRRVLTVDLADLKPGRVVYLRLGPGLRSARGESLWIREAWYTLNEIPN
ncbi:MAG: cytochrome C [Deltaproteobacteria bacterium]|nr:cytochrome C [Deltaproteobacteria bacterium]MBW2394320.1 cytochrome C [Deltaproteobacteria bacterium]